MMFVIINTLFHHLPFLFPIILDKLIKIRQRLQNASFSDNLIQIYHTTQGRLEELISDQTLNLTFYLFSEFEFNLNLMVEYMSQTNVL